MLTPVRILQVGELNSLIRADLEEDPDLQDVWVEAEIGTHTHSAAGHHYLTLKDCRQPEQSSIKAVMFRGQAKGLAFEPVTGQQVIAHGKVSTYASRGDLQLYLDRLEPTGVGALALAFQQLLAKLEAEGLFAPDRKRRLPLLPRRLAVVTSGRGAAIRDVIHVVRRRCPITQVVVVPTLVQGEGSPTAIAAALELAGRSDVDVVLLVRGGGSLEDLQAFNSELVARAVAACPHPVVAGVGHETDTTVVDYVADLRAPTPSVAAELVVPDLEALRAELAARRLRLRRGGLGWLQVEREGLRQRQVRLARMAPLARIESGRQDLDRAQVRLAAAVRRILRQEGLALRSRNQSLSASGPGPRLLRAREEFAGRVGRLEALSPLAVLGRGYSITFRSDTGQVIRDGAQVAPGADVVTRLHRGTLRSRVTAVEANQEVV
ncbi:MAG TPA: exodeoxyribonuclease VII large subunit [Candidatus Nanopelagicaceae bacterium]|nr:exodeoxyribonuclease VII large subunit [Candidatus Nanopelagicaceae bacterium]